MVFLIRIWRGWKCSVERNHVSSNPENLFYELFLFGAGNILEITHLIIVLTSNRYSLTRCTYQDNHLIFGNPRARKVLAGTLSLDKTELKIIEVVHANIGEHTKNQPPAKDIPKLNEIGLLEELTVTGSPRLNAHQKLKNWFIIDSEDCQSTYLAELAQETLQYHKETKIIALHLSEL